MGTYETIIINALLVLFFVCVKKPLLVYYFWIFVVIIDPNILFANSLSRIIFISLGVCYFIRVIISKRYLIISNGITLHIIFCIIVFLSSIFNDSSFESLIFLLEGTLIYLLTFNLITNIYIADKTLKVFLFSAIIICVLGIMEFLLSSQMSVFLMNFRTSATTTFTENGSIRVLSTFNNPIYLAAYTSMGVMLCASRLLIYYKSTKKCTAYGLALILCIVTLVMTQSQGSYFALALALLILITVKSKFYKNTKNLIYICITFSILITAVYLRVKGVLLVELDWILTQRVYAWNAAINAFIANPVLGIGPGNYTNLFYIYGQEFINIYNLKEHYTPHSDYLSILSEIGIVAILLYFLMIGINLKKLTFLITQKNELLRACTLAILGMTLFFLIHRSIDYMIYTYRIIYVYFILLGITDKLYLIYSRDKAQR